MSDQITKEWVGGIAWGLGIGGLICILAILDCAAKMERAYDKQHCEPACAGGFGATEHRADFDPRRERPWLCLCGRAADPTAWRPEEPRP